MPFTVANHTLGGPAETFLTGKMGNRRFTPLFPVGKSSNQLFLPPFPVGNVSNWCSIPNFRSEMSSQTLRSPFSTPLPAPPLLLRLGFREKTGCVTCRWHRFRAQDVAVRGTPPHSGSYCLRGNRLDYRCVLYVQTYAEDKRMGIFVAFRHCYSYCILERCRDNRTLGLVYRDMDTSVAIC